MYEKLNEYDRFGYIVEYSNAFLRISMHIKKVSIYWENKCDHRRRQIMFKVINTFPYKL